MVAVNVNQNDVLFRNIQKDAIVTPIVNEYAISRSMVLVYIYDV